MVDLRDILERYGETSWARRLDDDLFFLRQGDAYGATRFLGYFGGMSSLSDIVLCRQNGHPVAPDAEAEVNERLRRITSHAYDLARQISRDAT